MVKRLEEPHMRRSEFISLLAGTAVWLLDARAQIRGSDCRIFGADSAATLDLMD
jgi:hypothetical protein